MIVYNIFLAVFYFGHILFSFIIKPQLFALATVVFVAFRMALCWSLNTVVTAALKQHIETK